MSIQVYEVLTNNDNGYPALTRGAMLREDFVGAVLNVRDWTGPEPHWDSGWSADTGYEARVFNGRTWTLTLPHGLRSDMRRAVDYVPVQDATGENVLAALDFQVWEDWFLRITIQDTNAEKALSAHNEITRGKKVLVVKGRKIPQGTHWYVAEVGNGNYGPFVHLSSEPNGRGDYRKFVNPDNLTVSEPFAPCLNYWAGCPVASRGPELLAFAHKWNSLRQEYNADKKHADESHTLALLADWCEEQGESKAARVLRRASEAARPAGY